MEEVGEGTRVSSAGETVQRDDRQVYFFVLLLKNIYLVAPAP